MHKTVSLPNVVTPSRRKDDEEQRCKSLISWLVLIMSWMEYIPLVAEMAGLSFNC